MAVFLRLPVRALGVLLLGGIATAGSANETVTYEYDSLGRLKSVSHTGTVNNNLGTTYTYDPAGNRSNVAVTGAGTGGTPPPSVSFSISDASATAPNALSFTLTKTGTTTVFCSISYATSNGTGTAGTDYTAASGLAHFPAGGNASDALTFATLTGGTGPKTMKVTISNPTCTAAITRAEGTGTIYK